MDSSIPPLDTPKRKSLQSQADTLRAALKDFERSFAAEHNGRKPGKEDIKADAAIAAKYKEYNKVREGLAGKRSLDPLNTPHPRRRHERTDSAISVTPRRLRIGNTPSKSKIHPNEIDPYDPPSSASPKVILNAVGPTPRRDGTVLGIFDILSSSGSLKSSQETPSSRKRKLDVLNEAAIENRAQDLTVAQTPSQKRSQSTDERNQGLPTATPRSGITTWKRQHSKTPVSEGKRFMLNHFFATPSAVRFAGMMDAEGNSKTPVQSKTPLRDAVLGISPAKEREIQASNDATPPYLKRSFSFKERLLSASGDQVRPSFLRGSLATNSNQPGPRGLRHVNFAPRPLSQIIANMQNQNRNHLDENEDDLDALRDIESSDVSVLVHNNQANDSLVEHLQGTDAQPVRIWKKKGQKRTTRRSIMRPTKVKAPAAPKFVAEEEDDSNDEDQDELALEKQNEDDHGQSRVKETQIDAIRPPRAESYEDDDMEYLIAEAEQENQEPDDLEDEFPPDLGDIVCAAKNRKAPKSQPRSESKSQTKSKTTRDTECLGKRLISKKSKKSAADVENEHSETTRKINPNAYSHMNFRSLKIKNKNSKAKGRGRFGRGRR